MEIEFEVDNSAATPDKGMQEIATDLESRLYGSSESDEPTGADDDEVLEDGESLPTDDDSDSDEEEGSDEKDELNEIANEEELTLAGYLGVDDDRIVVKDDGSVVLNTIIDGETRETPLSDLVTSYQMQGHNNNKSMALEDERKTFEGMREAAADELQQRMQGVQQLATFAEEQLIGEFNNIDWDTLRRDNPAEWTALKQEYAERAQKIQQGQQLLTEEQERVAKERQDTSDENMRVHMNGELGKLIANNPTWSDQTIRKADMDVMSTFLVDTYGYETSDMDNVTDARLIEVVKDAKKYREGIKLAANKKVKRIPKFQKPGATRANASSLAKARSVKAKRAALKKDGSTASVANAILDRM